MPFFMFFKQLFSFFWLKIFDSVFKIIFYVPRVSFWEKKTYNHFNQFSNETFRTSGVNFLAGLWDLYCANSGEKTEAMFFSGKNQRLTLLPYFEQNNFRLTAECFPAVLSKLHSRCPVPRFEQNNIFEYPEFSTGKNSACSSKSQSVCPQDFLMKNTFFS